MGAGAGIEPTLQGKNPRVLPLNYPALLLLNSMPLNSKIARINASHYAVLCIVASLVGRLLNSKSPRESKASLAYNVAALPPLSCILP